MDGVWRLSEQARRRMMDDNTIRQSPYRHRRSLQCGDMNLRLNAPHLNGKFIYRIFSSSILFRNLSDCCLFRGAFHPMSPNASPTQDTRGQPLLPVRSSAALPPNSHSLSLSVWLLLVAAGTVEVLVADCLHLMSFRFHGNGWPTTTTMCWATIMRDRDRDRDKNSVHIAGISQRRQQQQ